MAPKDLLQVVEAEQVQPMQLLKIAFEPKGMNITFAVILQAAVSKQNTLEAQVRELGKKWLNTSADLERQTKRTREVEDAMSGAGKLHQQATQVRRLLHVWRCFIMLEDSSTCIMQMCKTCIIQMCNL